MSGLQRARWTLRGYCGRCSGARNVDIEIEVPWQLQPVDRTGARWPGDGISASTARLRRASGDELLLYGLPELEDDEEEAE